MRVFRSRLIRVLLPVLVVAFFATVTPASAATAKKADTKATTSSTAKPQTTDISGAVSQTYTADKDTQVGMIVALKAKDGRIVTPLEAKNSKTMLGVAIPTKDATILLTPQSAGQQQVLVASTGRHDVVVSNQNGAISVGDFITISALSGIGTKAGEDDEQILGQAVTKFTGTAGVLGQAEVTDTAGAKSKVALGLITVDVKVGHNPLFSKTVDYVPGFLAKIAVAISGKPISVARIYLCMAVLFGICIVVAVMMSSGIRSGMLSVGRNPLSKKSIIKSLIQTVVGGLIVFTAGIFAVYLLLKL